MSEKRELSIMKFSKPLEVQKFNGSKTQRKQAVKKAKERWYIKIVKFGLVAATVGGITLMADKINTSITPKEAITLAAATEQYRENTKGQEDFAIIIDELNQNMEKYEELTEKADRTGNEDSELIQIEKQVASNFKNVVELRTAALKSEIAESEGITDPKEIAKINIECIWESASQGDGVVKQVPTHKIMLPDGTIYTSDSIDIGVQEEIEAIKDPLLKYGKNLKDTETISRTELDEYAKEVVEYYKDMDYMKENNIKSKQKLFGGEKLTTEQDLERE